MEIEYTPIERIIMSIVSGGSNFFCIPALILMFLQERQFDYYNGTFTMLTSFMYHVTHSLDVVIYMPQKKWHQLDNIGSICCFNSLLISLMNSYRNHPKQISLNLFSIFFVTILQIQEPWDLFNTIFPITVFITLLTVDFFRHGIPNYNYDTMSKAVGVLVIALAMFVKGLDEETDYMRIAHSLWHILIGISTFYMCQVQEKRLITFAEVFTEAWHKFSGKKN